MERITTEQAKLKVAVEKARQAFDLLAETHEILKELGIDVNTLEYSKHLDWFGLDNSVLLSSGISNLSVVSEKEIESGKPFDEYGQIVIDGISFHQRKLPVERIDRYA